MQTIKLKQKGKELYFPREFHEDIKIVGDNNDYFIKFDLEEKRNVMFAVFVKDGKEESVLIDEDSTVNIPVWVLKSGEFSVGITSDGFATAPIGINVKGSIINEKLKKAIPATPSQAEQLIKFVNELKENELRGAQGVPGDKGDTGEAGKDGADGADGKDGLTAYEVYQKNGGLLTETQWLASLAQGTPEYASSTDEMTDTSKIYVGSDGKLWAYFEKISETEIKIDWKLGKKCSYDVGKAVTFSDSSDYCVSDFISVTPNTEYVLKNVKPNQGAYFNNFRVLACDSSGTLLAIVIYETNLLPTDSLSFTTPDGCEKIVIRPYDGSGAAREITLWSNESALKFNDTGIAYANYSLTDSDKEAIAEQILNMLDISHIDIDNTINVGTYTLKYDDAEDTEAIGEVTT